MNKVCEIVKADGVYLNKHMGELYPLAEDYHKRAGEQSASADKLLLQFFKHVDTPNTLFLVVEEDGKSVGFLFGMAHERLAFLNAAYLELKNKSESATLKEACLRQFDEWAKGLKCEQAIFTTFRGPYAHKWAEKFGWEYNMSVYKRDYTKP